MKVTKQETVTFSKGRGCFVRFECDGATDRALLREEDAIELIKRWNAAPEMQQALTECDNAFVAWQVGQIPGRPEDILALIQKVRAALAGTNGKQAANG